MSRFKIQRCGNPNCTNPCCPDRHTEPTQLMQFLPPEVADADAPIIVDTAPARDDAGDAVNYGLMALETMPPPLHPEFYDGYSRTTPPARDDAGDALKYARIAIENMPRPLAGSFAYGNSAEIGTPGSVLQWAELPTEPGTLDENGEWTPLQDATPRHSLQIHEDYFEVMKVTDKDTEEFRRKYLNDPMAYNLVNGYATSTFVGTDSKAVVTMESLLEIKRKFLAEHGTMADRDAAVMTEVRKLIADERRKIAAFLRHLDDNASRFREDDRFALVELDGVIKAIEEGNYVNPPTS